MNIVSLSKAIALLCFFAVAHSTATAQHTLPTASTATSLYIENKGQIGDQHGKPNHDVRFLILRPGLNIQLRGNGFSYDSYTVDRCEQPEDTALRYLPAKFQDRPNEEITYHFHRVDVDLVGANPKPLITATGASSDYLNYYTHITQQVHGDKGATDVRGYARVTYHDVWPGVDMEWFIDDQQRPEYQFVIRPGGNVAAIQLRYRGAHGTRLDAAHLVLDVQHGPIRESLPRSYVQSTGSKVDVRYRALGGNVYGFTVPPIDIALGETLVIDPMPELLWATYYGGGVGFGAVGGDVGFALAVTPSGDIVLAGETSSRTAIATAGAHQATYGGNSDAFVAALAGTGTRRWGTYYGGSDIDYSVALAVTPAGDIVLAGTTESTNAIATAGAHQASHGGRYDAFVAVFTGTGTRRWDTYYGGSDVDRGNALAVTSGGDILLAGSTNSSNAIATAGAHQATYGGGSDTDAFVAVFSGTGTRLWGTYYGGSLLDDGNALAVTSGGDIVLAGTTGSTSAIATAGAHQATNSGRADAFVAAFTGTGTRLWGTYYGGTDRDLAYALAVTPGGDIVLAGQTYCHQAIATTGGHRATYGGGGDAFVAAFTGTGTRLWGTYYGGSLYDYGYALAVTPGGDIVLAGQTICREAIATTGAHQATYSGGLGDAFVAAFTGTGSQRWGTYYGGSDYDRGNALAVTSGGDIVLAGTTNSTTAIATVGAHQATNSNGADAFVAVFRQDTATSIATDEPEIVPHMHTIAAISPNPASGHTVVTISATSDAVLSIVDVLGRVHINQPIAAGSTATTVSTHGLPSGSYYLRLEPVEGTGSVQAHTQALIVVP